MSNIKKIFSFLAAIALIFAVSVNDATVARTIEDNENRSAQVQVREPLNMAILIQDDLVARVGTELNVTREFIRSLPSGSRVMVAYIRSGSLQVRQPFTDNLE